MNVREAVVSYLKTLSESERKTLANMVKNGIICCHDYAKRNNITAEMFTNELKLVFKGE